MQEPEPDAERPSRQDLVIAPRQSNLPLILSALLCAGTGFGFVWVLGIGRAGGVSPTAQQAGTSMPEGESVAPQDMAPSADVSGQATAQSDAGSLEPLPFSPPSDNATAPRALSDQGWREPTAPVASPPETDRYPTRPASLETPEPLSPMPPQPSEGFRSSRFSPPGRFPGLGDRPIHLASAEAEPMEQPADGPSDQVSHTGPRVGPETEAAPPDIAPPADGNRPDVAIAAADDGAVALDAPVTVADVAPRSSSPSEDDLLAPPPTALTGQADSVRTAPSNDAAPPAGFRPPPAGTSAIAAPMPPSPPAVIGTVATNPFASAPPMGPTIQNGSTAGAMPGDTRGQRNPALSAAPGMPTAGQGRPGPIQLEGLQTPQLALEKRGPREIQVGKPARYEILVRNVGNAPAQDVMLRDAVPYGTTLITTTPPASPARSGPSAGYGAAQGPSPAAELVWPLGILAPGGEARVSMEVMPETEGDIGSVASVIFRTDASVRSRATKPDIRLEASEARAVRIGGEVKLSLKVTNPGTGTATGVVLDGLLPEGVSHSAGRELEFDVGQLRPGESRTIDLVMGTVGPGVHMARFTARADGRLEVEQAVRIEVTAPTLELTAAMPSRRYLQRPATCVLSMINAGTAPARAVELVAQLPPGMKFVRANHAGWYEERSHRVLWNLEELPAGETGTVEMVLMPVDLGPQKIVAAARSGDGPSAQAAHTVEVEGLSALFFEVTDSEDPIEVGGMTEYIVRVGNQGTKAASGVRLTATLLGDLEPVEAKGPAPHRVENLAVVFEPLAKLAPSEEAVFRIRVRGRREGDQRMQVQLVSDDHPAPISKEEITRVYADR